MTQLIRNNTSLLTELTRTVTFTPIGEEIYLNNILSVTNLEPVNNAGCIMMQIKFGAIYITFSGKNPDETCFEIRAGSPFILPLSLESNNIIKIIQKDINTKLVYLWGT